MAKIKAIETVYNGYKFRSRLEARWAVFFDALGVEWEYEPEGYDLGNGLYYLPDFKVKCYGTRGEIDNEPFDLWIEVKGEMNDVDAQKIIRFAGRTNRFTYCDGYCPKGYSNEKEFAPYENTDSFWDAPPCKCGKKLQKKYGQSYLYCCPLTQEYIPVYLSPIIDNPILVVGNIPKRGCSHDSSSNHSYEGSPGLFNYELIDGDYFAAYPAAYNNKFFLWGDEQSYIWNISEVEAAYEKARQARFEHGEQPVI